MFRLYGLHQCSAYSRIGEKSYGHPNKMRNRIYLFTVCCPHVLALAFWILLEVSWRFDEPEFLDMEIHLHKIERLITMYSARKKPPPAAKELYGVCFQLPFSPLQRRVSRKKLVSLHTGQVTHQAGPHSGFSSTRRLGIFLLSPGWDGLPPALSSPVPNYTPG